MRFLADESCDFNIVRALRAVGHDVTSVIEVAPGSTDAQVIAMAVDGVRTLITEDRDFGQLVHAAGSPAGGVILLRYPSYARRHLPETVVAFVEKYGSRLANRFVVVEPGRVRLSGSKLE